MIPGSHLSVLGCLGILLLGAPLGWGEDPRESPAGDALIRKLIHELDDERFAVREQAKRELLEIGVPAVEKLEEAARSDSPERRLRASDLLEEIRFRTLGADFRALAAQQEGEIEVEHGMWLVARILDPGLEKREVSTRLDEMAEAVRKAAGGQEELAKMPPADAMEIFTGALKNEFGLQGDTVRYDHPDNSSIHRVILRKRGLPIVLAEIAVAVARRLELPVVGLGIPGRYMIKYDGARAPEGEMQEDIIINPFEDWQVVEVEALALRVLGFDPQVHLQASPKRATLVRMLNNMHSDALVRRDLKLARAVDGYRQLLDPPEPDAGNE